MFQLTSNGRPISTIELNTGVSLSYVEQGDKTGEAVLMLSGYTDSSYSYSRVMSLLPQRYHAFAIDYRGHGDSSKPAGPYTMETFVADVIAFMDAKGIDKATIVGHSMGTMIAQLIAVQHPQRVSHLVLIDAFATGGSEGMLELNTAVQKLVDPVDYAFARDFQESTIFGAVPPKFLKTAIEVSLKMPAHIWRDVMTSIVHFDAVKDLPKIKAPTLVLWGDHDLIAPWNDQEILCQLIPDTSLQIYEQTGHALHWEQPGRFVVDLEQFWQQTKQPSNFTIAEPSMLA
jgi:pimeloyl-ACP methyl ester carboxylesterase